MHNLGSSTSFLFFSHHHEPYVVLTAIKSTSILHEYMDVYMSVCTGKFSPFCALYLFTRCTYFNIQAKNSCLSIFTRFVSFPGEQNGEEKNCFFTIVRHSVVWLVSLMSVRVKNVWRKNEGKRVRFCVVIDLMFFMCVLFVEREGEKYVSPLTHSLLRR